MTLENLTTSPLVVEVGQGLDWSKPVIVILLRLSTFHSGNQTSGSHWTITQLLGSWTAELKGPSESENQYVES